MLMGILSSLKQPHLKTVEATGTSFRFILHPFHLLQPSLVVVVGINNLQSKTLRIARTLILADEVLFMRKNIGIAIIDDGSDAVLHQTFNDGRTTGSTTGVKKDALRSVGDLKIEIAFGHKGNNGKDGNDEI